MNNFKLQEHGETVSVEFIKDTETLKQLCEQWLQLEVLVVDTEFDRTNTYFHNLALLQIFDGEVIYFIDPLQLKDLSPLAEVFNSKKLIKAIHSCSEDLEALYNAYNFKFNKIFDTQIAASFLDHGLSLGYLRLVELLEGISLDKAHTKTDWLQRPLTENQLIYAAQDVQFLWPVYFKLRDQLLINGHFELVLKDTQSIFDAIADPGPEQNQYADFYLRVKGAFRLNPQQTNRLKAIASWREQLAREKNIPRTFIFRDNQLVEICQKTNPLTSDLLEAGCHRGSIRRYGSTLFSLIEQSDKNPQESWPEPVVSFHKLTNAKSLVKALRKTSDDIARNNKIPTDVLSNKRLLEYFVLYNMKLPHRSNHFWNDWRKNLLNDSFDKIYQDAFVDTVNNS